MWRQFVLGGRARRPVKPDPSGSVAHSLEFGFSVLLVDPMRSPKNAGTDVLRPRGEIGLGLQELQQLTHSQDPPYW
jgi:hypothetical protein